MGFATGLRFATTSGGNEALFAAGHLCNFFFAASRNCGIKPESARCTFTFGGQIVATSAQLIA